MFWQAQGLPCEHRPDSSILALISITLVTAPRATDLPGRRRGTHGRCGDEADRAAGAASPKTTSRRHRRRTWATVSRATPITNREGHSGQGVELRVRVEMGRWADHLG